jgi:hypothetical protein
VNLRAALIPLFFALPVQAEIMVPSGQPLTLYSFEVIPQSDTHNLLFIGLLARQLDTHGYDVAANDMDALCRDVALPEVSLQGDQGVLISEISIRIADKPLGYGEVDPEVAQFMGFYEIISGECVWH